MARAVARYAGLPWGLRVLILAGLGVLAGLGQAPLDLWPLTVLALAALFVLYPVCISPGSAAGFAFACGIGYFGFSLRWITAPFMVDIATHGWMAPFALVLMAAGGAAFWALAGWVAMWLAPQKSVLFALMLTVAEVLRSLVFTGFPWALLGHVWVETPVAQAAAWGGPHLLSLLTVLAGWAIALLTAGRPVRAAGLAMLAVLAAGAFMLRPGPMPAPPADAPLVRLVQPNAPQHQKWDPAYRNIFLDRMINATAAGAPPDLVVWPETAVPYLLNHIMDDLRVLSEAAHGAPLVFGIQRRDAQGRAYNSLAVMGPGGALQAIYDKQHLVPFGEYIPGAGLLGRAGLAGLARNLGTGFTPGSQPGPVMIPGIGAAVPLICYEGIFAEEITYGTTRPRLLLLITNDAWFGRAAGPSQHLAQARLRAIEQGMPMVRVANTGISAMIDAQGRITAFLPLGVDGAIDVPLPAVLPETPYARRGDMPVIVLLLVLIVAGTARGRRR